MDIFINVQAVLIAAAASFILGFLWHGPLFGTTWIRLAGISKAEMEAMKKKGMGAMAPQMVASLVQQLFIAAIFAHLSAALGINDGITAALFAFLVWLGFVVTTHLNQVLWEKKTIEMYAFNMAYLLVSFVLMSVIVVSMG